MTVADSPMDLWRSQRFGSSANNPAVSGDLTADAPPALGSEPGILWLTYRRNLTAAVTEEILSDDGTTRVIKARVTTSTEPAHFLRLKVTRH